VFSQIVASYMREPGDSPTGLNPPAFGTAIDISPWQRYSTFGDQEVKLRRPGKKWVPRAPGLQSSEKEIYPIYE
jgi:hypothetical protein